MNFKLLITTALIWFPMILVAEITINQIAQIRMSGELEKAELLIEQKLSDDLSPQQSINLLLEMAKIQDRRGLHWNSRPVSGATENVNKALSISQANSDVLKAEILLDMAQYHYRREMADRVFTDSHKFASKAESMFLKTNNLHGQADAVHLRGLLELQSGNNDRAGELFDESLDLDKKGGHRTFFLGEYGRHKAFVYLRKNDLESALPLLEQSLDARIKIGATDASMFAAMTLASTQLKLKDVKSALTHASYAMLIAHKINSPRGKAQSSLILGQIFKEIGKPKLALKSFQTAKTSAEEVKINSLIDATDKAIESLSF